jgi:hypothetical protein
MKVMAVLMMVSIPAHGDVLLDLMNNYNETAERYEDVNYDTQYNEVGAEPEWYSWELGTNDSLPELIIIVDPYGSSNLY